jgi:hypothetical protein
VTSDLRYPIGQYVRPASVSVAERAKWIDQIAELPGAMRAAVHGLSDAQLDTPYRPQGWTVRQVVHHVADSHANAYCRLKLALTEQNPTIRPYDEARWAELPDSALPVDVSLRMIDAVHERWVVILRAIPADRFAETFLHPESGAQTLDSQCANYAWHSLHHTAHITSLRAQQGW